MREHFDESTKKYIDTFQRLEEHRTGLDFEIHDLVKEIDTEKHFKDVPLEATLSEI
jgi:hypothetical protein